MKPNQRRHPTEWSIKLNSLALAIVGVFLLSACSLNSAKKRYVLAEKLWSDGNYAAAVNEFEKVHNQDPKGKLGLQALYRAATTQALFLNQYNDAVKKLRNYAELAEDKETAWDAQRQIGDLLFNKLESYDLALEQYQKLLKQNPKPSDAALFLYRMGKARFYLWRFNEAIQTYREVLKLYPQTVWGENAAFELGVSYFTRGEQSADGKPGASNSPGATGNSEAYQDAIDAYEAFIEKYPKSPHVIEARFGIASCLEEMDQLEAAYQAFSMLKDTYPSPNVIQVKLTRIRERRSQRNR